jgi:hypothetical protein
MARQPKLPPQGAKTEEKQPDARRRGIRRAAGQDTPAGPKTDRTTKRAKEAQSAMEEEATEPPSHRSAQSITREEAMQTQTSELQHQGQRTMEQIENIPANVFYGGVIGSIALSALLFMMGRRELAIFVGLWPPTILNMVLFMKQLRPSREVGHMM